MVVRRCCLVASKKWNSGKIDERNDKRKRTASKYGSCPCRTNGAGEIVEEGAWLKVDAEEGETVGDLVARPANDESTTDEQRCHNGVALSFVCWRHLKITNESKFTMNTQYYCHNPYERLWFSAQLAELIVQPWAGVQDREKKLVVSVLCVWTNVAQNNRHT